MSVALEGDGIDGRGFLSFRVRRSVQGRDPMTDLIADMGRLATAGNGARGGEKNADDDDDDELPPPPTLQLLPSMGGTSLRVRSGAATAHAASGLGGKLRVLSKSLAASNAMSEAAGINVRMRLNAGDLGDGQYAYFASLEAPSTRGRRAFTSEGKDSKEEEGKGGSQDTKQAGGDEEDELAALGPVVKMAASAQRKGQDLVIRCLLCKETKLYVSV